MIKYLLSLVLILITTVCFGAGAYTFDLSDFSGGLNEKASSTLVKDTQATSLNNVTFDSYGAASKRNGYETVISGTGVDTYKTILVTPNIMDAYMHVVIGLGFLDFVKYGTFNGRFKSMFENMAVLDGAALTEWNNDPAKFITDLLGGKHTLATRVNFKALEDMDRGHKLAAQAA